MTAVMKPWEAEFGPEFDVPAVPDWLEDNSWHNDACPSFAVDRDRTTDPIDNDVHDLRLWIDHVDPEQREMGVRYVVNYQPWSNRPVEGVPITDYEQVYEGDDLDAAVAAYTAALNQIEGAIQERRRVKDAMPTSAPDRGGE